jgi:SagB-type dehydrogenase family enzyme
MFARICLSLSLVFFVLPLSAEELKLIKLSPPQLDSGKSLMQALKDRQSARSFSLRQLPVDVLSNLLWAADGINRAGSGKRTAPSAMNWQEIDIYVATKDGLYLYNPEGHALKQILNKDIRSLTGRQSFAGEAPVNLVYVSDLSRTGDTPAEDKTMFTAADAGFISQNVYLYCASAGLATVVRGFIDRGALAKAMKLRGDQRIILAQTVGYPKV